MFAFLLFSLCAVTFSAGLVVIAYVVMYAFDIHLGGQGSQLMTLFVYSMILGFGGAFISLMMSRKIAIWTMGVELIDHPANDAELFVINEVEELSRHLGIDMPQVGIFMSDQINAFATGSSKNSALVAVSSGLLEQMTAEEARAVIAHEMAHVKSGDMFWMTVINGISNGLVNFISIIVARLIVGDTKDSATGSFSVMILQTILSMVFGVFAAIFVMAFSRYREFRADAQAADWIGPRDMIAALQRLSNNYQTEETMPGSMQAFGIFGSKAGLFATHPSLDERIEALRNRQNDN